MVLFIKLVAQTGSQAASTLGKSERNPPEKSFPMLLIFSIFFENRLAIKMQKRNKVNGHFLGLEVKVLNSVFGILQRNALDFRIQKAKPGFRRAPEA